jgi:hypothetical protein
MEALKEQQSLIEQQNVKINSLEATTKSLSADISEIKKLLLLGNDLVEK